MRYTKPQITNSTKAHQLIQGVNKPDAIVEDNNTSDPQRCTAAAYEADE
jgi:hypothetical protein